jgi:hypothetical protein
VASFLSDIGVKSWKVLGYSFPDIHRTGPTIPTDPMKTLNTNHLSSPCASLVRCEHFSISAFQFIFKVAGPPLRTGDPAGIRRKINNSGKGWARTRADYEF